MSVQFEWDPKKAKANLTRHSAKTMKKKTSVLKKARRQEELKPEYRFDYSKAKPNQFAAKMTEGTVAVILEPDVAAIFNSSEAVNSFLRSVISATSGSKQNQTD